MVRVQKKLSGYGAVFEKNAHFSGQKVLWARLEIFRNLKAPDFDQGRIRCRI
jgi:hypothetical protein